MLPEITQIIRYAEPNKHDQWPRGTQCKVINSLDNTVIYYVQVSADQESPRWEIVKGK
jgi:hypothetical protein